MKKRTRLTDLNDIELWDLLMRMSASAKAISVEIERRQNRSPWLYPTLNNHKRPELPMMSRQ